MPYSWKNPIRLASLQPSVTVEKGKISFATMTHGCKGYFFFATIADGCEEANFMEFSPYIYKNELTSKNMYLHRMMAKKSQFHFLFFKGSSQNPKFSLQYLERLFLFWTSNYKIPHAFHSDIQASLIFNQNKILSPGLENKHTLKCCSDNFPT